MSKTGEKRRRRKSRSREQVSEPNLMLRGVDLGILGAIFAVPFIMGGRVALGEFALLVSASVSSLCWAVYLIGHPEHGWVSSKAEPLLIGIVLLGLAQITPLPSSVVSTVSPTTVEALPLWQDGEHAIGSWNYLSMSPALSRASLPTGISLVLLFIVTSQRIRSREDAKRILQWVAASGIAMAVLGVLQFTFANGSYYWFVKFRNVSTADHLTGAFPNKNMFGEYMGLTIGPIIWWIMTLKGDTQNENGRSWSKNSTARQQVLGAVLMLGLAVVVTSLFLSLSRGAIVATGIGVATMLLVLFLKSYVPGRMFAGFLGMSVLAVGFLFFVGGDRVTRAVKRLDNWNDSGRFDIWGANLDIVSDFPITGAGVGSHGFIYRRYLDTPNVAGIYTHAENSYLQIASETGLFGFLLCVASLVLCFWWCAQGTRLSKDRAATIAMTAITCSLIASCIHNLVDFGWYIQGTMSVFVVLMACAARLYQIERGIVQPEKKVVERVIPLPIAIGLASLFFMSGVWMMGSRASAVIASGSVKQFNEIREEIDSIKLTGDPEADKKTGEYMMKLFRQKLMALHKAVKADPENPELHYLLSRNYLVLFDLLQRRSENRFTLAEFRNTIEGMEVESEEEISEWLHRAMGENLKYAVASGEHAERALRLNPLQANAYLQVSETGFLMGRKTGFEKECVAQARALWPHDGQVLFIAGRDAANEGDLEKMMELWKSAFHSKPIWQERIINYVVSQVEDPVPLMIAEFEPSIDGLERIVQIVDARGDERDKTQAWSEFATRLMARAEQPENSDRVDDWLKAGTAYDKLGQPDKVTACLEKAIEAEPSSFVVNFEFGVWLHRQREHRKALVYFERCQLTRPDYPKLTRLIEQAEQAAYGAVRQASGQEASPFRQTDRTGTSRLSPRQIQSGIPNSNGIDNSTTPMLLPAPGDNARPAMR